MSDDERLEELEASLKTIQAVTEETDIESIRKNYLEADPEFKEELFRLIKSLALVAMKKQEIEIEQYKALKNRDSIKFH